MKGKYMSKIVKAFKMASGDEVITGVEHETAESVDFVQPLQIALQPVGKNQAQLGLIPFCISNSEATIHTIDKKHILGEISPINEQIEKEYLQLTSGIQLI